MPAVDVVLTFVLASLVLGVTPGPSVVYVTTRSLDQGPRAGMVSVAGLAVGDGLLVLAATGGLAAIVATSATAFTVVKYLGAAYLVWLGVQRLREPDAFATGGAEVPVRSTRRLFGQGVLVNALNPKSAIFFLALLPPFVDPTRGPVWVQTLTLGLVFVGVAGLTNSAFALAASSLRAWLQQRVWFLRAQRYVSAGVYVALGALVAAAPAKD